MPRKPQPKPEDPEQSKRFIATAREIGAKKTREAADSAFEKIVKPPKVKTGPT